MRSADSDASAARSSPLDFSAASDCWSKDVRMVASIFRCCSTSSEDAFSSANWYDLSSSCSSRRACRSSVVFLRISACSARVLASDAPASCSARRMRCIRISSSCTCHSDVPHRPVNITAGCACGVASDTVPACRRNKTHDISELVKSLLHQITLAPTSGSLFLSRNSSRINPELDLMLLISSTSSLRVNEHFLVSCVLQRSFLKRLHEEASR